jgi:hypothetical protein
MAIEDKSQIDLDASIKALDRLNLAFVDSEDGGFEMLTGQMIPAREDQVGDL